MHSPLKKKPKLLGGESLSNKLKRPTDDTYESPKKNKHVKGLEDDLQAKKRKNFIKACEIVSYKSYFDQNARFLLDYLPNCAETTSCTHHDIKIIPDFQVSECLRTTISPVKQDFTVLLFFTDLMVSQSSAKPLPSYVEESFKIEMKTNMWCEALEVCILCINPNQYLSVNVLKDIVEIMLNAHENAYADYTIAELIDKCKEIFELNFSYHPPCVVKSLRKCYNDFLTSPMDLKENTFTNRSQFECNKGIVKYCLNRLEYEISEDSKDGPLINKYENIPEDMRQSVKGLHWQKEKLEIYELLNRHERIERLMAVLDSIIELLQFDLVIWHSRYTSNLGSHIMRSHKPLMAYLLWSNNVLYTGAVNNNCRQILKLFIYLVHLQYPEEHIKIITMWLNTMIQTFYICESNSNSDYPNTGKYCTAFANEFYKLISGMPSDSLIRIIERIKPDYMQYIIGTLHIKKIISTDEEEPIRILLDFIKFEKFHQYTETDSAINIMKKSEHCFNKFKGLFHFLKKKCELIQAGKLKCSKSQTNIYPRLSNEPAQSESMISLNEIVHLLYVVLDAYLDAYSVKNIQETLDVLNDNLMNSEPTLIDNHSLPLYCTYSVTEGFIKKYRTIFQTLKEVMIFFQDKKKYRMLPDSFKIFEKIGLLK